MIATADSGIKTAADLKGKKIGIPGGYGSSWIMLQALLGSVNLTPDDVTIVEFPEFNQAAALQQGQVDAATASPTTSRSSSRTRGSSRSCSRSTTRRPAGSGPRDRDGDARREARRARRVHQGDARRDDEIAADPQKGLDATFAAQPDLAKDPALQRQVLDATIAAWKNPRTGAAYGAIDKAGWQASIDYMTQLGLVPNPVTVDKLVDESLLP